MDITKIYDQDEICELCELEILDCKHSTSIFLCEGSRCEDAVDFILEYDPYERLCVYKRKEKLLKIKEKICSKTVIK